MPTAASARTRIRRLLDHIETSDDKVAEAALLDLHGILQDGRFGWEELLAPSLEAKIRSRLVKILGMTGSSALGEARAAIARARAGATRAGVAWSGLFAEESGAGRGHPDPVFGESFTEPPRSPPPGPRPEPKPSPKAAPRPESSGPGFWTVQQCDSAYEGIWYTAIATADADKAERVFRDRCGIVREGGGVRLRAPGGRIAREWRRPG